MRHALLVLLVLSISPLLSAEVTDAEMNAALKTWRAFEMPEPPDDAELVILTETGYSIVNGVKQPERKKLVFKLVDDAGYFTGTGVSTREYWGGDKSVEKPDELDVDGLEWHPFILSDRPFEVNEAFALGLNIWARGLKKLGRRVTTTALKLTAGHHFSLFFQPPAETPAQMLPRVLWAHWANQLVKPDSDRKAIHADMQRAYEIFSELRNESKGKYNENFLKSLKLVIEPSDSKPGSIEADIAALSEACNASGALGGGSRDGPDKHYLKVLKHGFSAVPALIEHLKDRHLTRSLMAGFNNFSSYIRSRGELCGDILQAIACEEMGRDWLSKQQGWTVEKSGALKWWAKAKKIGEEAYLKQHMLGEGGRFNEDTLHIIAHKYPALLLEKYLEALSADEVPPAALATFLAESSLTKREKAAAFSKGAGSENLDVRWSALRALQEFDEGKFHKVLIATLDSFGDDKSGSEYWTTPEARYTHLVLRTDDQKAWDALLRAVKRAKVGLRMEYMNPMNYSYIGDDHKQKRLRLLAEFVNDETVRNVDDDVKGFNGPHAAFVWDKISVRDFVSMKIGSILGVEGNPLTDWTEKQWAPYRKSVIKVLKTEGIEVPSKK